MSHRFPQNLHSFSSAFVSGMILSLQRRFAHKNIFRRMEAFFDSAIEVMPTWSSQAKVNKLEHSITDMLNVQMITAILHSVNIECLHNKLWTHNYVLWMA